MSHGRFPQAHMTALAALAPSTDQLIYWDGSNSPSLISLTAAGRALLDDANAAAQLATMGAQAQSDVLDDLASLGTNAADGEILVGTGAGALAWESGATARTSLGLGTTDNVEFAAIEGTLLDITGNARVRGNLRVDGTRTVIEGEFVASAANYNFMNSAYHTNAAVGVGFVANYFPTTTTDNTTGAGVFTAGVDGASDPTVTTNASSVFSAGDIVHISGSTGRQNDGFYEVQSHSSNTLTIRSTANGVSNQTEEWTGNQFVADAGDTGCSITKVNVAVLRVDANGDWEVGKGSSAGITYAELAAADGTVETDRVTSSGTVGADTECVMGDTDGGAFTYNLQGSPLPGRRVFFKNVGTSGNDLTIGRGGNNIEGAASDYVLSDLEAVTLIYDSTEGWMVF